MILNKHYSEKVSATGAFFWRISIAVALIFMMVAVTLGLMASIYFLITRRKSVLNGFIAPMLSLFSLGWGICFFMKVFNNGYLLFELARISVYSLSIFGGFSLFAIGSLFHGYVLIKNWKKITNSYIKIMLLLTAFSLLFVSGILIDSGWIGLRTWKL